MKYIRCNEIAGVRDRLSEVEKVLAMQASAISRAEKLEREVAELAKDTRLAVLESRLNEIIEQIKESATRTRYTITTAVAAVGILSATLTAVALKFVR